MTHIRMHYCGRPLAIALLTAVAMIAGSAGSLAQQNASAPVDGAANESAAAPRGAAPITPVAASRPGMAFDLTQQPNEHPLAPVIRALKTSQETIDQNIRDYSCTLVKRERVDGELGEHQHIFLKVMHEPFSVYMSFLKPFTGREVLYVAGQNNNKMIVLEAGFKRYLGKLNLDPQGAVAMNGQKHPITRVGIRNLTAELIRVFEAESQYAECEVTTQADAKINGRSTTMVQITHPVPRQVFRSHIARIFFDNELRVPIHYDAYLWPSQPGGEPPLDASYTYTNLQINNGFTARDFDAESNPEIFK